MMKNRFRQYVYVEEKIYRFSGKNNKDIVVLTLKKKSLYFQNKFYKNIFKNFNAFIIN